MTENRNDPFAALGSLNVLAPMQDCWRLWAGMQQSMLQTWMSGWAGLVQSGARADCQGSAWPSDFPNPWASVGAGVPGLAAFMPRVDAVVTPLETKGVLAGAAEAARLSMRIAMPGCLVPAEMLLVEAVVARAPAAEAERLTEASRKLLPKG